MNVIPSPASALYFVSLVGPSVLIGFFILLSIFNQNLKGIAYFVGICVLFTLANTIAGILSIFPNDVGSKMCGGQGLFSSHNGLAYGTLIYVFSFCYLLFPMVTNGIVNMPLLVSLVLVTVIDSYVNLREKCSEIHSVGVSIVLAALVGTLWSILIYSIKPELTYHMDYISSNKLACSLPSKQKFKCVVKQNGEIIG